MQLYIYMSMGIELYCFNITKEANLSKRKLLPFQVS
ncbi:hypothetical protein ACJIZ3_007006 [Penstemon smallii]|uniref:Ribosomal protein L32 n=1 Tax=Penstemon smallii TaxID=265156 RepID=A0ABD3S9J2_9LAMI